jgi:hypothetical protein
LHHLITTALLALSIAVLPTSAGAQEEEEEFTCRDSLLGTRTCESDSGTTIRSRPDLFGNTNSTVTRPDGETLKCRSRPDLFGRIHTVCE